MVSVKNKIVFISGASAGIGKACAYIFAKEGAKLIISARRLNSINQIADDLRNKFNIEVYAFKMDVRNKTEVEWCINSLPDEWREVDILINNAGLARGLSYFYEDEIADWEEMIDTNVKGLLYVTRFILPGMAERKRGHVINIGSIAGHEVYPKGGIYCATKHAVDAITKSLRIDTIDKNIRVSTVDPGMVETDFSKIRFYGDEEKAQKVYKGIKPLTGNDIAETILFCATRPSHVNINEIIIMPTAQASSTIAFRKE